MVGSVRKANESMFLKNNVIQQSRDMAMSDCVQGGFPCLSIALFVSVLCMNFVFKVLNMCA